MKNIKNARLFAGITQAEVSEKANISLSTYTMIENGKYVDHYREDEVFGIVRKMILKRLSERRKELQKQIQEIDQYYGAI